MKHPISQTLLLISSSEHGEFFSPTFIPNQEYADNEFGGQLARAYSEASQARAPAIWGMRIPSTSSPEELYFSFQDAYDVLQTFPADIIVPVGAYADQKLTIKEPTGRPASFARQLGRFCQSSWNLGSHKLGLIGTTFNYESPLDLLSYHFYDEMNDLRFGEHFGPFVSVCASRARYLSYEESYDNNTVVSVAGAIAAQDPSLGLTNIVVNGSLQIPNMPDRIHRTLARNGMMSIQKNPRRGNVLYKAITGSTQSPYHSLTAMRMLANVLSIIREQSDQYFGDPVDASLGGKDLEDTIVEILDKHSSIIDYNYSLYYRNDTCFLDLEILLRGEITAIKTVARLN